MKTEQPILIYLLLTLFVGLKLAGEITWSWWWVTSPAWLYLLAGFFAAFIIGFAKAWRGRKHEHENGKG